MTPEKRLAEAIAQTVCEAVDRHNVKPSTVAALAKALKAFADDIVWRLHG